MIILLPKKRSYNAKITDFKDLKISIGHKFLFEKILHLILLKKTI